MEIGAGGDAQTALQGPAQIGQDVAEEIRADYHVEAFGLQHEAGRQRVNMVWGHVHIRIIARDFAADVVPHHHRVLHRIRFGRARQSFAPLPRQIESVAQHTLDAAPGEYDGLLGDLVRRALLETSAPAAIFAFGIFAHTDEVDLATAFVAKRALRPGEQLDRAQVDVLVEALAYFDQHAAQADVIGHARRIADRAQVDRGEILQTSQGVIVHHPPCLQVVIAAPGEFFGLDLKAAYAGGRPQRAQARGDYFLADAISGDDGYAVFFHGSIRLGE